jgi:hypothetical protein
VCYERGWEAQKRNEEATNQIRRLFARYRAEAKRARPIRDDSRETKVTTTPSKPDVQRDDDRELVLH